MTNRTEQNRTEDLGCHIVAAGSDGFVAPCSRRNGFFNICNAQTQPYCTIKSELWYCSQKVTFKALLQYFIKMATHSIC